MRFRSLVGVVVLFLAGSAASAQQSGGSGPELGLSWKTEAEQALGSGRLDSAQVYLERWLEADPRDQNSWYNLACIYALQGMKEKALDAWEASVAAGWDDPDHPMRDGDLESIREDQRFIDALEQVRTNLKRRGPEDFRRHFTTMTSTGTYVVMLPPDYENNPERTYPLCVILHGSGSSELAHGRLSDALGREGVIYLAPRAPYPHSSSFRGTGELGYSSWTVDNLDSLDPLYREVPRQYAAWIMTAVDDARRHYRISDDRIMILGHSQGAAFSYITACLYPERVRSILAYAGYFPDDYRSSSSIGALVKNHVHVALACGADDRVVDPGESQEISGILEREGVHSSLRTFEETGHGISRDVMEYMKEWVEQEKEE